jgi:prepilin peptidase CpaA
LPRISDLTVVLAVAGSGGASALVDLRTRRVPNPLTLGIITLGVALAAGSWGRVSLAGALAGFAVGLLLMLPGHLIGATGAGDVKLFAAFGTLVGPQLILAAFLYTAIAGGLLAVAVAVVRRRLRNTVERTAALVASGGANVGEIEHVSQDNRFAYAPAIAVGTLLAALGI